MQYVEFELEVEVDLREWVMGLTEACPGVETIELTRLPAYAILARFRMPVEQVQAFADFELGGDLEGLLAGDYGIERRLIA